MKEKQFSAVHFLIFILAFFMLAGLMPARAETYDAGTMRLLRYEGDVEILDKDGQPRFVLENVRFASGETMQTGSGSMASVSLDSAKIVTLDADTRVAFTQESSHLMLRLLEGTIFLDVQEKLDENESLDIQTSTMTIGIRGTMVCVSHSEDEQASRTQIMLLEGKTDLDYQDSSGSHRLLPLSAGQKADVQLSGGDGGTVTPAVSQLSAGDIPALVRKMISEDPAIRQRVREGSEEAAAIFEPVQEAPAPETVNPYPDQGDWTWNETVTLVAQSASKLYDGEALTRSSNVLVYGLPGDFTIDVSARGSQTDAGTSENMVSDCVIRNAMGEDVTGHFRSIRKISGQLVVNPIPVSVWTGSAEKYYDGEPLTNPEAGIRILDRPVSEQPDWGNTSVVSRTALGSEAMIAVSGSTWVHAANPITKETQDIELMAGQRLTVCLKNEQTEDSIYYQIDTLRVEDLPDEILILYANNPGLLSKACEETGWDPALLAERINALDIPEESAVTKNGLTVQDGVEERLLTDSASVRIDIDSAITNYSTRALTEKEAQFTPIVLNADITVTAAGSQTEVGSSENGYTISWGGANENNYVITGEDLGTLTVLPKPIEDTVVIQAVSDSKTYDGKLLRNGEYTVYGLPAGYRVLASVSGSRTDAGITENRITDYHIYGPSGEEATDQFLNVLTESGILAVNSAPLWITTGSAEKVYDGEALENTEASIEGLVSGETAAISATGILTGRTGTADNPYEITWGTAKKDNYYIVSEKLGTLTIEPLAISIDFGGAEADYDGSVYLPDPVLTYTNGPHAGETLTGIRMRAADALFRFVLFTQDTVDVTVTGMGTDAGTYSLSGSVSSPDDDLFSLAPSFSGMTLTINPRVLTIETPSASKPYDGSALTAGPAKVTGLVPGETVTVTAAGSQTAVGESENTCTIAWDTAKESNYTVIEQLGTLKVSANAGTVILTAASAEKVYDGAPLTADGVHAEGLPAGFAVTASLSGSRTDAGSSANEITSYTILDGDGNDVTGNFTNVEMVSGTLTVGKAPVTIATGSASKPYDGTALTNAEVSVTGLSGADQARVTVTATGSQTGLGESENTYSIDWGGADKDNYTITESLGKLTVEGYATPVVFTALSGEKVYDGTPLTAGVTAEGLPAGFTFAASAEGSQTAVGTGANKVASYQIFNEAAEDVTVTFIDVTVSDGTLTVKKAALTIATDSAQKPYDGTDLTAAGVTVTGLAEGEEISVTAAGRQRAVGSSENSFTVNWGSVDSANYTVTEAPGTLTVTPNDTPITLTAQSMSMTYDGEAKAGFGSVTVEGLPSAVGIMAEAQWSARDAGEYPLNVSYYLTDDELGGIPDGYFTNITTVPGTLTVLPAALTVTTGSAEKKYDGTALTNAEASVTGLAEADKDQVTVTANGSRTAVGESENTYTIAWGTAKESNYTVQKTLGTLKVTANDGAVTLTAASAEKVYDGTPLTADGVKAEGLPAGFTVTASVSGSQTDAGTCKNEIVSYRILDGNGEDVTAGFADVTTVDGTLTVNRVRLNLSFTGGGTHVYDGSEHAFNVVAESPDMDDVDSAIRTVSNSPLTFAWVVRTSCGKLRLGGFPLGGRTDAGTYELNCTYTFMEGNPDNFFVTVTPDTAVITPAPLTVSTGSAAKVYDGTALTAPAEVTGLIGADQSRVKVTTTGTITDAGTAENTYTVDWGSANAGNYTITEEIGTLTVEKRSFHFTTYTQNAAGTKNYYAAVPYCGENYRLGVGYGFDAGQTVQDDFTLQHIVNDPGSVDMKITWTWGDSFTFHATGGSGKDAGDYPVFGGVEFHSGNPANYNVDYSCYPLEITPAELTVTTGSASRAYDGTALTNAEVSVTGLAETDKDQVTVTAAGSQTAVGESENTFAIAWGTVKENNYTVSKSLGKLTVTANDGMVTLTAASEEKVYDGTVLTADGVTAEGLPAGFTVSAAVSGSQKDAGSCDNTITSYTILDSASQDVTGNFTNVATVTGTLTVTPAELTVTTGSASRAYDGTALTNAEAFITGLAGGETAAVTATGAVTAVGTAENTYAIEWGTAKAGNYTLTENLGELQVTVNSTAVTFTAGSASKPYDGTALTLNKVTASGLPSGLSFTASASGSRTDAGTGENTVFSYVILDGTNADVTANFNNITTVPGELTVTPRKVSFDLNGTSRKYNSLPLFPSKVTGEDEDGSVLVPTSENSIGDYYLGLPYKLESVFSLVGSDEITVTSGPEFESGCTDVGSYTIIPQIVFSSGDSANYEFSYINNIFSITRMNIRVDVLAGEPVEYDGAFHTGDVRVYVEDAELTDRSYYDASKKWRYDSDELSIYVEVEGGRTDAGESDLTCSCNFSTYYNSDPSGNINLTVNDGVRLTVLPKPVTVSTGSAEKVYDGTALTAPGTLTGLVASDESKVTWNATGTITDAGTAPNTYTINWGDVNANNYAITENLGTLKVKPAPIKVSTKDISESKTYDGNPSPVNTARPTISGWHEAGIEAVSQPNQITDVGEIPLKYEMIWGSAKESNYEITEELGTLSITPLPVTFDMNCYDMDFNGYPALPDGIEGTYGGGGTVEKAGEEFSHDSYGMPVSLTAEFNLIGGGKVRLYTEGQVNAGSFTLEPEPEMLSGKAGNYVFSYTDNTGSVSPLEAQFSLGGGYPVYYDGQFHGGDLRVYCDNEGFFSESKVSDTQWRVSCHNGDAIDVTITGGGTELGTYTLSCTYAFAPGTPANYDISFWGETLEIKTIDTPVTFTAESLSKTYDGTPLSGGTVEMTEGWLLWDYTWTGTVSGSRTDAGIGENGLEVHIFNENGIDVTGTYTNLTLVKGTLTVEKAPLTIKTGSASKAYDGTPLEGGEATVTGLVNGETITVTTSSLTEVGTAPNNYTIDWGTVNKDNYTITDEIGTLEVTAADTAVTLTAASAEKYYDGTALTSNEITAAGLPGGFTVEGTTSGSQTDAGSSKNTVNDGWVIRNADSDDVTAYFTNITRVDGTLTVRPAKIKVSTKDISESKTYDGQPSPVNTDRPSISGWHEAGIEAVSKSGQITDVGTVPLQYEMNWGGAKESNYEITEELGTLTITQAEATVTTGSASKPYDGTALTNTEASISGLKNGETAAVTATGSQTEVGSSSNTYDITWVTAKEGNYNITDALGTLEVTKNNAEITLTAASASKEYDGDALTNSSVTAHGLPEGFTVEATASGSQTDAGESANVVNDGYIIKNASGEDKTANFTNIRKVDGKLTVTKATVTVTTGSAGKAYDGTALTSGEASIAGLVTGETAAVTATGSQTEVGSSANSYSINWGSTNQDNYQVTEELGTLEVIANSKEITLTAASASKSYDSTALTKDEVTASGLPEGFTVEATASGSQTDAGYSANVVNDGYVIKNASGADKTANFTNVRKVDGKLTVSKATVTVTTNTASKTYDGTALFGSDASVSGLVSGETVTVNATGSRTDAGTSDNTYAIIWDNAKESNYTVHEELGKLTVEKRQFRASSFFTDDISGEPCREAVYNGKEYYVNIGVSAPLAGYSVDHSPLYQHEMDLTVTWWIWGDSCTFHATGSARDAGEHSTTCVVEFSSGNPDNYEIEITCDKLKITPAPITVTARSEEKKYDGSPLPEVTDPPMISGSFYGDDYLYAEHTGESITDVGTEPRGCTYSWGGDTNPDNYSVSVEQGSLTVTKRNLIVRSSDAQKPYDGEPLTMHEYSIEGDGLAPDETITVNFTGTQTEPYSSPNTFTVSWDTAKEGNYDLVPVYGTLTVTEAEESGFFGMFSLGTKDAKQEDGNETDPTAGITDETGETGEPPEPDPSADPPDETGDQAAADQQAPPGGGLSDESGADGSEPDPQMAEPADAGGASGPDAAEPQSGEATDTEETAAPDSAADPSGTELTDSVRSLPSRFTFSAMPSGGQAENSLRDDAAHDGDAAEDAAVPEAPDEAAGDVAVDDPWTAEPLYLEIDLGGMTVEYGRARSSALKPKLTYMSGDYAGLTVDPEMEMSVPGGCEAVFRLLTGDTLTLTVSGFTSFDAGVYPLAGSCRFSGGAAWNTVVDYTNDTVTVTPSQLTVASLSAEKDYDGEPLVRHECDMDGLAYGETIMVNYTGSQTEPGTSENTFTVSWGTARETNYLLNPIYGTLTVNDPGISGVLKPADATPAPTATPPGEGDGEGEPEPTPVPPGEEDDGSGETDPAADQPGEEEDGGGGPDPDVNPPEDPPASDGGEEGSAEPDPAADPPEENGEAEELPVSDPSEDPPEESGWADSAEPDLLPSDPEESSGAEDSGDPEPFFDPPDAGGFFEPDPVIPDNDPSGGHVPQESVSDPPETGE